MNTELIARNESSEAAKEKLVKDLKGVIGDADNLVKEVANSTAAGLYAARTKLGTRLTEARYRLDDARIALTEKARGATDATQEYVMDNPWKVLGVAAAAGFLIGVLLSRR